MIMLLHNKVMILHFNVKMSGVIFSTFVFPYNLSIVIFSTFGFPYNGSIVIFSTFGFPYIRSAAENTGTWWRSRRNVRRTRLMIARYAWPSTYVTCLRWVLTVTQLSKTRITCYQFHLQFLEYNGYLNIIINYEYFYSLKTQLQVGKNIIL